jgi:4a-hydroxytetrahydrobiopterin dehydratase
MSQLSQFACSPIGDDEPALTPQELENLLPLVPSWSLVVENGVRKLRSHFIFSSEAQAHDFIDLMQHHQDAEHHPVQIEDEHEGRCISVTCFSSKVEGLHPNDFIMAARADGAWSHILVGRTGDMARPGNLPTISQSPRFRRILSPQRRSPQA